MWEAVLVAFVAISNMAVLGGVFYLTVVRPISKQGEETRRLIVQQYVEQVTE